MNHSTLPPFSAKEGKAAALSKEDKQFIKKQVRAGGDRYIELYGRATDGSAANLSAFKNRLETALNLYLPYLCERYGGDSRAQQSVREYADFLLGLSVTESAHKLEEPACEMAIVTWLLDYFEEIRLKEERTRYDAYSDDVESSSDDDDEASPKPFSLEAPTYKRFQALLPTEYTAFDNLDVDVIYATDFQYSDDEKARMLCFLHGRKDEYAEPFRKMLTLIDPQRKDQLIQTFVQVVFAAIDTGFALYTKYQSDLKRARQAVERADKRAKAAPSVLMVRAEPPDKAEWIAMLVRLEDLTENNPAEDFFDIGKENFGLDKHSRRKACGREVARAIEEYESALSTLSSHAEPEDHAADGLDPYDLCFAAFLLEPENAPILAFDAPSALALSYAISLLPWAFDLNAEAIVVEDARHTYQRKYLEDPVYYTKQESKPVFASDADEKENKRGYYPTADVVLDEEEVRWAKEREVHRLTFDQLAYIAAGFTLPRNKALSRDVLDFAVASGASDAEVWEIAALSMAVNLIDWDKMNAPRNSAPSEPPKKVADTDAEPVAPVQEQAAGQVAQLGELKRQLAELKTAYYAAERENAQLTASLDEVQKDRKAELAELAELRERFFRLGEDTDTWEDADDSMDFTYMTAHRIVVFGGHDSWRKVIRPMLPGVRFYESDVLSSPLIIRNADIVFFQTNSISHKLFYVLINEIRRTKTEYQYLGYASARKCAEEIIRRDREK